MRAVYNFILRLIFGEESLDGYNNDVNKTDKKITYVYSTVFPSRQVMEKILKDFDE